MDFTFCVNSVAGAKVNLNPSNWSGLLGDAKKVGYV